jgi:tetratricopeptide (TPR) repeat protein
MKLRRILVLTIVLIANASSAQSGSDDELFSKLGSLVQNADSAQNLGDYAASEKYRRQVVSIMTQARLDPVEIARQQSNLSSVLNINGKPKEAEKFARDAKELLLRFPTNDKVQLAVLSGNLAEALRQQSKLDEARINFEEELKVLSEISLIDSHLAASAMAGLGAVEAELGDFKKAFDYYEKAIPIFLGISDESHPVTQRYLQEFGKVKRQIDNQ